MTTHRARKIDHPACYHARGLNPSPSERGSLAWPRMTAGSDRFRLRELRVSQHFSTFYGSSVQSMDTRLGVRHRRRTPPIHRDLASVSSCSQKPLCGLDLNPVDWILSDCVSGHDGLESRSLWRSFLPGILRSFAPSWR